MISLSLSIETGVKVENLLLIWPESNLVSAALDIGNCWRIVLILSMKKELRTCFFYHGTFLANFQTEKFSENRFLDLLHAFLEVHARLFYTACLGPYGSQCILRFWCRGFFWADMDWFKFWLPSGPGIKKNHFCQMKSNLKGLLHYPLKMVHELPTFGQFVSFWIPGKMHCKEDQYNTT